MNIEKIKNLIKAFYPYAKKTIGFDEDIKKIIYITKDRKNSEDPLGKTAYYNPEHKTVTLFILNRHPKDILRSFAHELTHHGQHCRGDFEGHDVSTPEGYAQTNPTLRKAEKEAYESGIIVRDWSDELKKQGTDMEEIMSGKDNNSEDKQSKQVRKRLEDEEAVNELFDERRNKLNKKLMDKFIKPTKKEGSTE